MLSTALLFLSPSGLPSLGKQRKEILELEVRKEELHLQALLEEGRKYDRIIDGRSGQGQG